METIFFDSWSSLGRTLVVGVLAYCMLVAFLRVSGKRTLSKMNAFDLVVTVSLGSTLATVVINKDVSLAEGAVAMLLLIGMQFLVTWSAVRSSLVRQLVSAEPTLLLHRGRLLDAALRSARVTEDEVRSAVRAAGIRGLDDADAVVLETDGSMSVVRRDAPGTGVAGVALPAGEGRSDRQQRRPARTARQSAATPEEGR